MRTSECEKFWKGEFGDAYTRRNRVDWRARIPFWRTIIEITGARSVFEFGCNAGWNLSAIQRVDQFIVTEGCDVNESAIDQAMAAGHDVWREWPPEPRPAELVFTAGVLIHIPPDNLEEVLHNLYYQSTDWVLAVEYDEAIEVEVEYRGHTGRLWRRPYGELYQDMGLELVQTGDAQGFDQCKFWLLRKPA